MDQPASSGSRVVDPAPTSRPNTKNRASTQRTCDDCPGRSAALCSVPSDVKISVQPAVEGEEPADQDRDDEQRSGRPLQWSPRPDRSPSAQTMDEQPA